MEQALANCDDPLVRDTAARLTREAFDARGEVEKLFYYVSDAIEFGFPPNGDLTSASETIRLGIGQCNTKGTLFLALCKAAGIPARLHFSLIDKEIQRGLFHGLAYRLLPPQLSHAWLEVEIDGTWRRIDGYINDAPFFDAAREALRQRGWDTGFSVAGASGEASIAFAPEEESFVQMDAVVDDHGIWDEPAKYYRSPAYRNRPGLFRRLMYRLLVDGINDTIETMRTASSGQAAAGASAATEHQVDPSSRDGPDSGSAERRGQPAGHHSVQHREQAERSKSPQDSRPCDRAH